MQVGIWMVKSREMRWMGNVARMEERRGVCRVWWGNLRERGHLEDPGVERRIILRSMFKEIQDNLG